MERQALSGIENHYDSNLPSSNPAPPLENSMFSQEKRGFGGDSGDSLDDSPGAKAAHKTIILTGAAPAGMDMLGYRKQQNSQAARGDFGEISDDRRALAVAKAIRR